MYDILEILEYDEKIQIKLILNNDSGPSILNFIVPFNTNHKKEIHNLIHSVPIEKPEFLGQWLSQHIFYHKSLLELLFKRKNTLYFIVKGDIENLPLELAFYENSFLSLIRNTSRFYSEIILPYNSINTRSKFLIIADPLSNLKHSYEESLSLYHHFRKNKTINVDFLNKEIEPLEFIQLINNYKWIYYSGHGEYLDENNCTLQIHSQLKLTKNHFSLIENPPELFFMNACLVGKSNNDLPYSFIEKLMQKGLRNVISSNSLIPDGNYSDFIKLFFDKLFECDNTAEALRYAKIEIFNKKSSDWIYFQLYGH